ncbi:DUF6207 family protein [Streptomyces sp. NPDC001073]
MRAITEAEPGLAVVEVAARDDQTVYAIGSLRGFTRSAARAVAGRAVGQAS